jgi:phosphatidylethanolamine/phosphatidyl-N-methylethanolamine N-methyltransferase
MKKLDLDRSTVETAYARWAPIYDAVCGPVMVKGRRAAAAVA